ncbi:hypothetical protein CAEBREN_05392 [Caenorhabditis brenneri]|uniref:F-box domain-containing protein n=1 Tax=Caenorhabditis brenneri TaxID=135651 RepID=G0NNS3_CAEBE|nr:hypothetical protein CAEBREN_05392 [Caenorhabditis brenneri]
MLPLLRLPGNAIIQTVRIMDMSEILGLSLASKRCKRIVINAKSRAEFFQVIIGSSITFAIKNSTMQMWLAFSFTDEEPSSAKRLRAPSSVRISTTNFANPIEMMMDPWDSSVPKNILIQNFETFIFGFHSEDLETMKLEDLLLMNSKYIDVQSLEISPKEFNKFLKLWIQGALPQLEYLSIVFPNTVEEDEVMNGINYQKNLSERIFSRHGDKEKYIITDGMDFYGRNGLKAIVQINYEDLKNYFEFFVIHDYCIVSQL